MKLTLSDYTGTLADGSIGLKTATLTPTPAAIEAAAKQAGYQEKVPNPTAARDYELKMAEVLAAEPNSPERAALQQQANALQAASRQLVDNPMPMEEFVVVHVRKLLASLLIDQSKIQQASAEAAAVAEAAEATAAAEALQLDVQDGSPSPVV